MDTNLRQALLILKQTSDNNKSNIDSLSYSSDDIMENLLKINNR